MVWSALHFSAWRVGEEVVEEGSDLGIGKEEVLSTLAWVLFVVDVVVIEVLNTAAADPPAELLDTLEEVDDGEEEREEEEE